MRGLIATTLLALPALLRGDGPGLPRPELHGVADIYVDARYLVEDAGRPGARTQEVVARRLRVVACDVLRAGGISVDKRVVAGVPQLLVWAKVATAGSHPRTAAVQVFVAYAESVRLERPPHVTPVSPAVLWHASSVALVDPEDAETVATAAARRAVESFVATVNHEQTRTQQAR